MKFCQDCHNKLDPFPASHRADKWLHDKRTVTDYPDTPAKASALHALNAQQQIQACEVCHGDGGANSKFCKGCHEYEMPHPDDFKGFHSKSGKANEDQCRFCHRFREICSNCHHIGASTSKSWISVHGGTVNESGAGGCLEKCHKQDFCVDCHTSNRVVPASHERSGWTRRASSSTPALHTSTFEQQKDSCTYCHGANGPNDNRFCNGCHELDMPHPDNFGAEGAGNGGIHAENFNKGTFKKATCDTCHNSNFCNRCHHPEFTTKKPWVNDHPRVVNADGAAPCFECHEETYCSFCHVRRAQEFLD
jgi:hypothetical protein